ncbi:hypothetical protein [Caproiciproducens sp. CPB-2]|uniref:hypothetical protein n=1 Tax=Caproiciproducens sp. CPB-2 TaxID=3030017 RepID=UPI0023DB6062|nr:hypothetical protein [Caproiciproducens sp. CPB-2]MDF1493825.1 hypothetical protein [Caproiciproducens sp. CPB-2]
MNKTKKDIPLDSFTIVVAPPVNRLFTTCINIYQDGKFNMNGKLSSILGGKFLQIRLTDNCRNMCILEADSAGARQLRAGKENISKTLRKGFWQSLEIQRRIEGSSKGICSCYNSVFNRVDI